ncbi:nuclear transport factor 2 family protein [Maricaulis sp.]|uniref:nuclear transport factor 2 family protein n=1 Tax=Maricaulis sp. TaxID=1486257 RepID=UPI001B16060E|nr:nuclear transport factor 2 family protein [Maricaulis sp.]MBO6765342.1 nuclear transport factor 2 family protein [Maricaulis sp.]
MSRKAKPSASRDVQLTGDKTLARQVAAAREAFNTALDARDMPAIADVLSEEAMLVPGDEAQLITGRQAQLDAWEAVFASMPDIAYVRAPVRVEISEDGLLAAETGRWRGSWSMDGMSVRYSGRYFAKWRHDGTAWRIEAETFVTMKRAGGAD